MKFPLLASLTGLVQGLVVWAIWHAGAGEPASPALTALLYAALTVPPVLYGTEGIASLPRRVRLGAVAGFGIAFALLGAYTAWAQGGGPLAPAPLLAAGVLGFVSLQLLCGFDFATRRWDYAGLFQASWRNGVLLATSAAMTGGVWMVLLAGAALMQLVGVQWVMDLVRSPLFVLPVSGFVAGGAFALGLARAELTAAIRRFGLSIAAWLLPLVLAFGVLWVLMLPWSGLSALLQTRRAAWLLLCFTALAVCLANCAYQDGMGRAPYPRWLNRLTQAAWLSLLPLVAIAWWALGQRIAQHGLTEQRLWAALTATLAAIYTVGYALSWRMREHWMGAMARTNIAAALALCLGLVVFLTPLGGPVQRLAVQAHLDHLARAGGALEPDWTYLRWQSGRFGREALTALAAGQGVPAGRPWARQASEALAQTQRYAARPSPVALDAQTLRDHFAAFPAGKQLPDSFIAQAGTGARQWELRNCLETEENCAFWIGDLNGDGIDEIVLFHTRTDARGSVFTQVGGRWLRAGALTAADGRQATSLMQLQGARATPPQWRDLLVGDRRLHFRLQDH